MDTTEVRVKDLMQTKVKTVAKDATLIKASKLMRDQRLSSLIVEPDNKRDTIGIITRKDIVEALLEHAIGGTTHLVEDAMSKPAISINADLSIHNCLQIMRMVGVRRLPVMEGNTLVGIISNSDIFTKLVEKIP